MLGANNSFPKISNELKFVLSCTNETKDITENIDSETSLDWDMVLNLALTHGFYPYVYNTLSQLNRPEIPEYVLKIMQQRYIRNTLKVIGISDEIVRITKHMKENDIETIILKGPPLSLKINEDITLRPSGDIDILVDPLDFAKAEELLEHLEYRRSSPDFQLTSSQQNFYFKNYHHFEYYHKKRAILVELHWRIRSFNVKDFPSASNLNIQTIDIAGCPVHVMDDEYWLIFLMVHGYKHKWERLRWLYDIKQFIKQDFDWDKVTSLAEKSDLSPILHQTLLLLKLLYNIPIPDRLVQPATKDYKAWQLSNTVMKKLVNPNNKDLTISKFAFLIDYSLENANYNNLTSNLLNNISYKLSLFKPTETEFKLISLPDVLFPLYYLIKPFYFLRKSIQIFLSPKQG